MHAAPRAWTTRSGMRWWSKRVIFSRARIDPQAPGVVTSQKPAGRAFGQEFISAVAQHRHWGRGDPHAVPA